MKRYYYNGIKTQYLISMNGDIYSEISGKFLKPFKNLSGYLYVSLFINKKEIRQGIHQIVACTYIPNPENKPQVNHKDGNKLNNCVSNLEWSTQLENNIHAIKNKLRKPCSGEDVHFARYTEKQIEEACKLIEENIITLSQIEARTGVPAKTLGEIRHRKIWKDISKKYKFPEKFVSQSKYFSYSDKQKIINYILDGVSTRDIAKTMGIEDEKAKVAIQNIKYLMNKDRKIKNHEKYLKMRKKLGYKIPDSMNKDQRSSTTCVDGETPPHQTLEYTYM